MICEDRQGFSLLEILIAVILLGFVGIGFSGIYLTANRYLIQDTAILLSQGDAAFAADHIRRQVLRANRIVLFTDAKIAFRFDPSFPGTPTDFSDDQWAGYRLNGNLLVFAPAVSPTTDTNGDGSVNGMDDPIEADLDGAAAESPPVAGGVQAPGGAVPALFQLPTGTLLKVDLTVQKQAGGESRQTRLKTDVSPRGVIA
ncbi:MAG: prepilin-type N-terminal cleavage/methylation domain-containing protein [Candidatus Omnitrophica bacterium]|nr:prepilin-type N-terminal cleavage/methylation domain-containing protein [Candidatus Omnitrophota bacterium]